MISLLIYIVILLVIGGIVLAIVENAPATLVSPTVKPWIRWVVIAILGIIAIFLLLGVLGVTGGPVLAPIRVR